MEIVSFGLFIAIMLGLTLIYICIRKRKRKK